MTGEIQLLQQHHILHWFHPFEESLLQIQSLKDEEQLIALT